MRTDRGAKGLVKWHLGVDQYFVEIHLDFRDDLAAELCPGIKVLLYLLANFDTYCADHQWGHVEDVFGHSRCQSQRSLVRSQI